MATEVTKVVASSGGDYTSLNAFEAGEQRDLVAADEIAVASCANFEDTTKTIFAGWTTDSTRYIKVVAQDVHGSGGAYSTSAYRLTTTASPTCTITSRTHLEGIQLRNTGTNTNSSALSISSSSVGRLTNCILRNNDNSSGVAAMTLSSSADCLAVNTVFIARGTSGWGIKAQAATIACSLYNCIAVGQGTRAVRLSDAGSSGTIGNCYGSSGSGQVYELGAGVTLTTSAASDTTGDPAALDSVPFTTAVFQNVTSGSENLRHKKGTALHDAGTDVSASSGVSTDIDGRARGQGAGWDVGIYEVPVSVANRRAVRSAVARNTRRRRRALLPTGAFR